ncbi:hypothetical protein [Pseudanabaena mucicola]|uniref:DUF732 domain-containing protein n=1 Tax=Pseudanabaena mucicola FACHB-723 TaxID=2692860 RepID=A0ABR8A0A3_9CYAN|nr:hypothetical protein [Pseudanabaena mucicola]MBD2189180.1 hypothetical protein [Pseudanabaena mucicola FACHB-723]
MIKHFAGRLLLPVSIALAVASCQQPSATTTSSPSVSASAPATTTTTTTTTTTASPTASASPSASPEASAAIKEGDTTASAASASEKTKAIESVVKENAEYKEMYEATKGIEYIALVETESCKALDSGVPLDTLVETLEKEFDKQGDSIPADKLTKLKEYTGFVLGASVVISCPQHKDKIKS